MIITNQHFNPASTAAFCLDFSAIVVVPLHTGTQDFNLLPYHGCILLRDNHTSLEPHCNRPFRVFQDPFSKRILYNTCKPLVHLRRLIQYVPRQTVSVNIPNMHL